jgi:hypothetical protein
MKGHNTMPRKSKPKFVVPNLSWWKANQDAQWVATDRSGTAYWYWKYEPEISEDSASWTNGGFWKPLHGSEHGAFVGSPLGCPDWRDSLIARPDVPAVRKAKVIAPPVPAPTYLHSSNLRRAIDLTGHAEDDNGNSLALATMYATIALAEAAERIALALQAGE